MTHSRRTVLNRRNGIGILPILKVLLAVGALGLVGCGGHSKPLPTLVNTSEIANTANPEQAEVQAREQGFGYLVKVTMRPQEPLESGPGLPLPSPMGAFDLLPEVREGSSSADMLTRPASSYEDALPHNKIARDGDYLVFNAGPGDDKSALSSELSFAAYRFSLAGYDGSQTIGFDWGLPPSG